MDEKGKGKGKGVPRAPPMPASQYVKPEAVDPAQGPTGEGKRVQVTEGPHDGKLATVLKVAGEGKEVRWRVKIDGGPDSTWVDAVIAASGEADGSSTPKAGTPDGTPKHSASPKAGSLEEGSTVEVVGGPHAGKLALVLKKTGDGAEARWRVMIHGGGPSTWVDKVKASAGGADGAADDAASGAGFGMPQAKARSGLKRASRVTEDAGEEAGDDGKEIIEVASGPHKGKRGHVLKVTGNGGDMRWRVQLDDGISTWVDDVNVISGGSTEPEGSPEMPQLPKGLADKLAALSNKHNLGPPAGGNVGGKGLTSGPIVEGRLVEVTDGIHQGKRGKVIKVTGSGDDVRYRVELDGSSTSTWVTALAGVNAAGRAEAPFKPKWPVTGPGSDDGMGTTDDEMPRLLRFGGEDTDDDDDFDDDFSLTSDPEMPDLVGHLLNP